MLRVRVLNGTRTFLQPLHHADISDPNKYKPMRKSSLSLKVELGAAPVTTLGVVLDVGWDVSEFEGYGRKGKNGKERGAPR